MLRCLSNHKRVAELLCEMTVFTNKDFFILKQTFNFSSDNQMSFYDELQMQVTNTVQNILHGHGQEVVNVTGRSCHRWRLAPDCSTRQSNAASDRQRLAPSPNKRSPESYPTHCCQQGWCRGCCEVADWQQWKPETLAAVTRPSYEPYWPMGALSCCKMKKSPEITRISGSISCFSCIPEHTLHLFWRQGPRISGG